MSGKLVFFLTLLLISTVLRFYQLGLVPNGLSVDEADIGYNAFSILKTGKDVYGRGFPLFFQSLDDFKPGLPVYSLLVPISLFGLSDFAIRIVPALLGSLVPFLAFMITKLMYKKETKLPYLTLVFFALAPWGISLSRAMIFYVETLVFFLLFFLFFFLALRKHVNYLFLSVIFLGLSIYSYYASFIYLPFLVTALVILYRKFFITHFKKTLMCGIILALLLFPSVLHYMGAQSKSRLNAISVLTPDITLPVSIEEQKSDMVSGFPFGSLIHNRRLVFLTAMLENYFDYFNFDYLFVNAKNIRYFYVNNVGMFYILEIPFALAGLWILFKRKNTEDKLLLFLILVSPFPAMITLGSPFVHRALLIFIPLQIVSAVGAYSFFVKLRVSLSGKFLLSMLTASYIFSTYFFLHQYFMHSPAEFSTEFDNGAWFSTVRDVIPKLNEEKANYDKVIFTWSQGKLVPPIYYLFYNKIDPRIIQDKAAMWDKEAPSYKQVYNKIDNIEFRPVNWDLDRELKDTLIVAYPHEITEATPTPLFKTFRRSGEVNFVLVSP